ncbi:MAG: hypothetical protein JRI25_23155 [Deltaproteobacteria bacterium]|nr:hypothetical protein [Deltaproteobacteria bacterium]MBW2257474.1 hypothetical protein [Deltaproteobacteria bacterium]
MKLALLLVTMSACATADQAEDTNGQRDSGGIGYSGPYDIREVQHTCTEGSTDIWGYQVRTEGWADRIHLYIAETGGRREQPSDVLQEVHPMVNAQYDADGTWDQWELQLLQVPEIAAQEASATTRWGCDADDSVAGVGGDLAWMALMYSASAPQIEGDCAIWGFQAQAYFNDQLEKDCTCRDVDTDCTN